MTSTTSAPTTSSSPRRPTLSPARIRRRPAGRQTRA
jgi:hypothetical protein